MIRIYFDRLQRIAFRRVRPTLRGEARGRERNRRDLKDTAMELLRDDDRGRFKAAAGLAVLAGLLVAGPERTAQAQDSELIIVSAKPAGTTDWLDSTNPSISADGRRVAFESYVALDPRDGNTDKDVYVKDLETGEVFLASAGLGDRLRDAWSPSISADGMHVAFQSERQFGLLGPYHDVYVRNLETGELLIASAGRDSEADNRYPSLSADGRFVAFSSTDEELFPGDPDDVEDVYVRDLVTGELVLASTSAAGVKGNDQSRRPILSADGTSVAFASFATNLLPGDVKPGVFVKNLLTGTVRPGDGTTFGGYYPSMSSDGTRVAFQSRARNLHPGDTDTLLDIFVKNLATGDVLLASVRPDGTKANRDCIWPAISADGARVVFVSKATNLDPADTEHDVDCFVNDLVTGEIRLVPHGTAGSTSDPSISADGRRVALDTDAADLDPHDPYTARDVYVVELESGEATLASYNPALAFYPANGQNLDPRLSGDGSRVAFTSEATNLAESCRSGVNVFVKDIPTGEIQCLGPGLHPMLSRDGRLVVWTEGVFGVADDGWGDVLAKDLLTGDERLVSATAEGDAADGPSSRPSVSADGTRVVFASQATNLSPDDTDTWSDIYLKDLTSGEVTLLSITQDGVKGDVHRIMPDVSADGRRVVFLSGPGATEPPPTFYVKDIETGELFSLGECSSALCRNPVMYGEVRPCSISGDGRKVAVDGLEIRDVASGESIILEPPPGLTLDHFWAAPRLSHDASRLILYGTDFGPNSAIFGFDLVSGEQLRLTPDPPTGHVANAYSALSADGTLVAFAASLGLEGEPDHYARSQIYLREWAPRSFLLLGLGAPVEITLTPSEPTRALRFVPPPEVLGQGLSLTLTDADSEDANAIYFRWGDEPYTGRFHLAADRRGQASQRLVVPVVRDQDAFVLARGNVFHLGSNTVTVLLEVIDLAIEGVSATHAGTGGSGEISLCVTGAGFSGDTVFTLEMGGEVIASSAATVVSADRAELVFALQGANPGLYDLVGRDSVISAEAILEDAFEVVESQEGPALEVELLSSSVYRHNRLSRMTLRYRNSGAAEMTVPLLKVVAPPGVELRLDRDDEFRGGVIQVLGIHPGGVAGKLPPGGEGEIPLVFRTTECEIGGCTADFQVFLFTPTAEDFVGWDVLDPPASMGQTEWSEVWPPLSGALGASWRDYASSLAEVATRLSRRGAQASSVREIFRFAVRDASGSPSAAILGRLRLADAFSPLGATHVLAVREGEVVSSALTDPDGAFALDFLQNGETYTIAVEDHTIVETNTPSADITMPDSGDLMGLVIAAAPEANSLEPECPDCDESALPDTPILPPDGLFTPVALRGARIIMAWDPNEKDGPGGEDDDGIVGIDDVLVYTIYFENLPQASAAAQRVVITDQLDSDLDWSTFRIGGARVGSRPHQILTLDAMGIDLFSGYTRNLGRERYSAFSTLEIIQTHVVDDLTVEKTLPVEVEVDLDPESGLVTWVLNTVTTDVEEGFLLPNDAEQQGEGHVSFSMKPRADADDDTEIVNEATIQFDELPPIQTAAVRNVIRRILPPSSPVYPVPPDGGDGVDSDLTLSWSGRGTSCDVYLWRDGEPRPAEPISIEGARAIPVAGLEPGTLYRWQVLEKNEGGEEAPGEVWTFRTLPVEPPPDAPVPREPPDGAEVRGDVVLDWEPVDGADAYDLFFWMEREDPPALPHASGIEETEFRLGPLPEGVQCYWKIVALNARGETVAGPWSFTTASPGPLFVRGMCNDDEFIDVSDAVCILEWLFLGGGGPVCKAAANVNGDANGVDVSDPVALLGYLFLGGERPADPYPQCGVSELSIDEELGCSTAPLKCQ